MQAYTESRRPSERTEQFLRDYLSQQHHLPGDRLPSPRQIASQINVSEGTVRGVLRKWLGEGKLRSRKGSGIFICEAPPATRLLRIGSNVRSHEQAPYQWGGHIRINVLEAVSELGSKRAYTSIYSSSEEIDSLSVEEVLSRCEHLDGMILYQTDPQHGAIMQFCRERRKPYVYLNPPGDDAAANFVALENFTSFYRITRALRDAGRKRFAVLISPELERSVSIRERLSGVINGIGSAIGRSVELRIIDCLGVREEHGQRAVEDLWGAGTFLPDAILAAGDGLAIGAVLALKERGVAVPKEVSVIAGAGFHPLVQEYGVTTLLHPIREIGRNLVGMLMEMLEREVLELPARILPIGIRVGKTTTAEESRKLAELFASRLAC